MSLTAEDLSQVRDAVVSAIQELVLPRFDEHDKRLAVIERDIRGLNDDVRVLKQDVAALKEDVRTLTRDMRDVKGHLARLDGRLEALEADIKELYAMVNAQKATDADKKFAKLSAEQKILRMYENFKLLAQEMGITLPN